MKLQQLLEIIQTDRETKKTDIIFDYGKVRKKTALLIPRLNKKIGLYARVYNAGNPHTVVKTNHIPTTKGSDSYLNYITYISDNNLAPENPFFPRIYKIQYLEDRRGEVKYKIEMESLRELDSMNNRVLIAFLESLFSPEDYAGEDINRNTFDILGMQVDRVIRGMLKSKNESLNDAGAIIRKIKMKYSGHYDVHANNIMVRLSPIPQLVITDPLA